MRIVQTQLALTTAHAGLATQAMEAFVKVKIWEPVDNNDLNRVVASSGLSENKDLGDCRFGRRWVAQSRGLI